MSQKTLKILLYLMIALVIGLAVWVFIKQPFSRSNVSNSTIEKTTENRNNGVVNNNINSTVAESNNQPKPGGWSTYTDPIFGYSIQYPPDWSKRDSESFWGASDFRVEFSPTTMANTASVAVSDLVYSYQGDVWIDIFENPEGKTVEAFVQGQTSEQLKREKLTVNGQQLDFYKTYCPFRTYGAPTFSLWDYPFCEGSVLVAQDGYIIALQYGPTESRNTWATFVRILKTFNVPADPTATWLTLENHRFGHSFKYPSSWTVDRQTDVNFGMSAHQLVKTYDNELTPVGGVFNVFNNGGVQRALPPGGMKDDKGGSNLPDQTIDGVTMQAMKIKFWDHAMGIDPVAGSPGPGFYHAILEVDYQPPTATTAPTTWGSPSWIALYPDSQNELTVPRMMLKTFKFDENLLTPVSPPACTAMTDQQKFDQADVVALVTVKEVMDGRTNADVDVWYKMKKYLEPKSRPYGVGIVPTLVTTSASDISWTIGQRYLVYLNEFRSTPYPVYTADRCAGTRVYDGSLTTSEDQALKPI